MWGECWGDQCAGRSGLLFRAVNWLAEAGGGQGDSGLNRQVLLRQRAWGKEAVP